MAKTNSDPIGPADLVEYLETSSDFAFELVCVRRISQLGFQCQHGGTYIDPVTKKPRQFDIRARLDDHRQLYRVRCAIECKNLSESFPVLVMCVPRPPEESFHELVFSFDPERVSKPVGQFDVPAFRKTCAVIRVDSDLSQYHARLPVGKSLVQVGRANGRLTTNDAEVYEKWAQALSSVSDLADEAALDGERLQSTFISLVLPILVVPDGTLWKVEYWEDGSRNGDPKRVDRCSFFIGREYSAGNPMRAETLTISHLEFVTLTGLEELLRSICSRASWFPPPDTLQQVLKQQKR